MNLNSYLMPGLGTETCAQGMGMVAPMYALDKGLLEEVPIPSGKGDGHSELFLPHELSARHLDGTQVQWPFPSPPPAPPLWLGTEMLGMPNHLGRCEQMALLKGAKPVRLPSCARINKGLQLSFFSLLLIVNRQVLDHFLIHGPGEIPYHIPAPKWLLSARKRSRDSCSAESRHSRTRG